MVKAQRSRSAASMSQIWHRSRSAAMQAGQRRRGRRPSPAPRTRGLRVGRGERRAQRRRLVLQVGVGHHRQAERVVAPVEPQGVLGAEPLLVRQHARLGRHRPCRRGTTRGTGAPRRPPGVQRGHSPPSAYASWTLLISSFGMGASSLDPEIRDDVPADGAEGEPLVQRDRGRVRRLHEQARARLLREDRLEQRGHHDPGQPLAALRRAR